MQNANHFVHAECVSARYADIEELYADVLRLLGDQHPIDWVRECVAESYFEGCRRLFGGLVDWDMQLPEKVFANRGGVAEVPLTMVAFGEFVVGPDGKHMSTCWKEVSKCRLMSVLRRTIVGGKGLDTNTELPALVVSPDMQRRNLSDLQFCCAHAGCTTRLMGAHVALRMILALESIGKNPCGLPQVQKLLESLARMSCHCRFMTAAERTVWALGHTAEFRDPRSACVWMFHTSAHV